MGMSFLTSYSGNTVVERRSGSVDEVRGTYRIARYPDLLTVGCA
jgi:hypothetical protein